MQHTSVPPSISGSTNNGVSVAGGVLGMGGSAEVGVQDGNLYSGTSSATNWGPVLQSGHTHTESIGRGGISQNDVQMSTIGGQNGISSHQADSSSLGPQGYHTAHSEGLSMGGHNIYSVETSNDNCCCGCSCNCCGEQASCGTSACCGAIGDCLSSCFSAVKTCCESGIPNCAKDALSCALEGIGGILSAVCR